MGVVRITNANQLSRKIANKKKKKEEIWQVRPKDVRVLKRWEKFNLNNAKQVWKNFEDIGRFTQTMNKRQGPFEGVTNAWRNQPAFVVGSSISARGFDLTKLNGKHSIGVNHMIEYYDGFEWFLFQDQRFMRITKYDLKKYKGKLFCHNNTAIMPSEYNDVCFIKSQYNRSNLGITLNIKDGLYPRVLTGACGLHLALISGANPIYMIGLDTAKDENLIGGHHYREDYTGEHNIEKSLNGTLGKYGMFKTFYKWRDRIINVCENGRLDMFKMISYKELEEKLKELKNDFRQGKKH
jgi:hypothetical protein